MRTDAPNATKATTPGNDCAALAEQHGPPASSIAAGLGNRERQEEGRPGGDADSRHRIDAGAAMGECVACPQEGAERNQQETRTLPPITPGRQWRHRRNGDDEADDAAEAEMLRSTTADRMATNTGIVPGRSTPTCAASANRIPVATMTKKGAPAPTTISATSRQSRPFGSRP